MFDFFAPSVLQTTIRQQLISVLFISCCICTTYPSSHIDSFLVHFINGINFYSTVSQPELGCLHITNTKTQDKVPVSSMLSYSFLLRLVFFVCCFPHNFIVFRNNAAFIFFPSLYNLMALCLAYKLEKQSWFNSFSS